MDETEPRQGRWEPEDARMSRFSGLVGEVDDPLTWGLDLEEEAVTGHDDAHDPTCERFLRAYRTFAGESLEVETLRAAAADDVVEDVVRAAASGALAAPLHADIAAPVEPDGEGGARPLPDFADEYQDYRSAMRAIVAEVDRVPLERTRFAVDGTDAACARVTVRDVAAVYVPTGDRALVITGPADLVDRVDVVTRPIRPQLQDDERGSRR
ncbi:hypothetical protein [Isoptericola variabilis]|uniref:Uncharacterized protein n=1 Tax=Isoptericola variabilis (strain 225) TaxID=743718 RepID=F6FU50_ISOV2|nr:hypothetical protein [Isoptericola variabilis]AEG43246.1 hypothetical protein Isova_0449 [Isoptericola variabilis 225]TWH35181.1 hypothetical protein L600_000100001850 [Isoptericola variabilis J7]